MRADDNGRITEVRPLYYGLLFFTLAGEGRILQTTQNAGGLNVIAHALQTLHGTLTIFVLNKTPDHLIAFKIDVGRAVRSASLQKLTASSLSSTTGIAIQGASIGIDGSFSPGQPTPLSAQGSVISGALEPSSAALIEIL